MSYPIKHIDGLDAEELKILKSLGIRTTDRLLEAAKNPKGRDLLAAKTGYDKTRILAWANAADRIHPDHPARTKVISREHLDEFTFRFNRRNSRSRGKLFLRLAEQAVAVGPAPYKSMVKCFAQADDADHNI